MRKKEPMKNISIEKTQKEEVRLVDEYTKLRYSTNISQRNISDATGLAQSTVARLEKNLHSASLGNFIKILEVIGYHLEIKKN